MAIIAAVMVIIGGRLVMLQGFDATAYAAAGEANRLQNVVVDAPRGAIVDAEGHQLAYSVETRRVVADPTLIDAGDRPALATVLASKLNIPYAQAMSALMAKGRYSTIAKDVDPDVVKQLLATPVNDKPMAGIIAEKTTKRIYPNAQVGAGVVGFVDSSGTGKGGVEASLNDKLTGTNGKMVYERAPGGVMIPAGIQQETPAVPGSTVTLTVDSDVQYLVQNAVDAFAKQYNAPSVNAVILEAKTGKVVAMYGTPGYDSNDPGAAPAGALSNPAISDPIEPGSVNKVTTIGPALDKGLITPTTMMTVPGQIQVADRVVHDWFSHGDLQMTPTGVLAISSNVGTLLINQKLGINTFYDYLQKFGVGSKSGIELPGESAGILQSPDKWSGSQKGNVPIGQGVSMTALQLASIYQTIANHGQRIAPRVVQSITAPDGKVTTAAPSITQVLSQPAADTLLNMSESVTGVDGTAKSVQIAGYRIGGKTGTAQRPNPACGCYAGGGYYHTFVGVAPIDNPSYVVALSATDPTSTIPGVNSLFATIMGELLQTKNVPPSTGSPANYDLGPGVTK